MAKGRRTALRKSSLNLGPNRSPGTEGLCRDERTRRRQHLRAGAGEEEPVQPTELQLCGAALNQHEVTSWVTQAISRCCLIGLL